MYKQSSSKLIDTVLCIDSVLCVYHEASSESSSIPCCSMGLKRRVSGKGTLAVRREAGREFNIAFPNKIILPKSIFCLRSFKWGKSITCDKSWKGPVDPASDEDHGKYVGDVSLHHVSQHAGICVQGAEQLFI